MTKRKEFEIRVGRIRSRSGARKAVSFFNQIERATNRANRTLPSSFSGTRSGGNAMRFYRRVVIKASFKTHASGGHMALKKHVDYIQRDGTDEHGGRAEVYGSDVARSDDETDRSVLPSNVAKDWKDDRHHFRFVIAPEDGAQLSDLSAYTCDLVSAMEVELGTKLEWIAADHYNTSNPHTHLVVRGVRDDGSDLVIPRRYLARGIRRQAERLVEQELGPVTQIERRVRLAKTVDADRVTDLDRALQRQAYEGVVDLSGPAPKGRVWHRQLLVKRMRYLTSTGLAEPLGGGRWEFDTDAINRLKQMGERNDIVKTLHRSMTADEPRLVTEDNIFDPNRLGAEAKTGLVRRFGKVDDTRETGFVIIEVNDGRLVHATVADDDAFRTLRENQVVTLKPHHKGPRSIDRSILEFSNRNGGVYDAGRHATESDRVSIAYARAHERRLEALRRRKVVIRRQDGTWRIPGDYLDQVTNYEAARSKRLPVSIDRDSQLTMKQMETARGVTWLDRKIVSGSSEVEQQGSIGTAMAKRKAFLQELGVAKLEDGNFGKEVLKDLQALDLRDAAASLTSETGKAYAALGGRREIDGIYREAIERPSGKFAVIERSREFTLVPWRPIMERRLGRSISGRVSARGISWNVVGRRGPSR
ncbi:DUF3363 domain-containing protein [uncultured Algimonas sp.]|uniref:DUF3363 domain-containing protein n=1 Tax=uncultured Algimonas sp. TaxID=1547920 RepID=UPI00263538F3|nr:DUF3363 domain-containing protein [uncultured Algimonas sp.]